MDEIHSGGLQAGERQVERIAAQVRTGHGIARRVSALRRAVKGRNRHHYEYWTDIDPKTKVYRAVPMPRKFFVEMVMDRIAACKIYHGSAYTDADALNYLVHAEEVRDGSMMHPDTRRELLYVLTMLRDRGEKETFRFLREVVLTGKPFAVPAQ